MCYQISACGIDPRGKRKVKVVTEVGRLECLYGEAASNVLLLALAAQEAAEHGALPPSPQILFDAPSPFYNSSLDEVVESTFADQVTVGRPMRLQPGKKGLTDEDALRIVSDLIKKTKALDFELFANTPHVIVNTEKGPRQMFIPLQPRNGVGTVRSANYAGATLKSHLMDSVLDLDCAARYRHKRSQALFILRPAKVSERENRVLDSVIDNVAYRSPPGLRLEVETDPQVLAAAMTEWAEAAA